MKRFYVIICGCLFLQLQITDIVTKDSTNKTEKGFIHEKAGLKETFGSLTSSSSNVEFGLNLELGIEFLLHNFTPRKDETKKGLFFLKASLILGDSSIDNDNNNDNNKDNKINDKNDGQQSNPNASSSITKIIRSNRGENIKQGKLYKIPNFVPKIDLLKNFEAFLLFTKYEKTGKMGDKNRKLKIQTSLIFRKAVFGNTVFATIKFDIPEFHMSITEEVVNNIDVSGFWEEADDDDDVNINDYTKKTTPDPKKDSNPKNKANINYTVVILVIVLVLVIVYFFYKGSNVEVSKDAKFEETKKLKEDDLKKSGNTLDIDVDGKDKGGVGDVEKPPVLNQV